MIKYSKICFRAPFVLGENVFSAFNCLKFISVLRVLLPLIAEAFARAFQMF